MSEGNSVVNFGDLSKPATVLIEKVCNAVGVLYEPRRIVKKAEAEARAETIKALASIELDEVQQRAIDRLVHQEARKQRNIESITAQAASQLPPHSDPSKIDEDWVANFFSKCETVSDSDMQSLWSRLLSGEAVKPGTYSKKTVELVSTLDKADAQLFTSLCQFLWFMGDLVPFVIDVDNEIYRKNGINFSSIKHLSEIGLISFEIVSDYVRRGDGKTWLLHYYGTPTLIEFQNEKSNKLTTGKVLLTKTGQALARISGSSRNEEFYQFIVKEWVNSNLIVSSMLPNK